MEPSAVFARHWPGGGAVRSSLYSFKQKAKANTQVGSPRWFLVIPEFPAFSIIKSHFLNKTTIERLLLHRGGQGPGPGFVALRRQLPKARGSGGPCAPPVRTPLPWRSGSSTVSAGTRCVTMTSTFLSSHQSLNFPSKLSDTVASFPL